MYLSLFSIHNPIYRPDVKASVIKSQFLDCHINVQRARSGRKKIKILIQGDNQTSRFSFMQSKIDRKACTMLLIM